MKSLVRHQKAQYRPFSAPHVNWSSLRVKAGECGEHRAAPKATSANWARLPQLPPHRNCCRVRHALCDTLSGHCAASSRSHPSFLHAAGTPISYSPLAAREQADLGIPTIIPIYDDLASSRGGSLLLLRPLADSGVASRTAPWRQRRETGLAASDCRRDVVETIGQADGDHQGAS